MTLRETGKNKNNLKVLFYSKVFFNLCFTFSAFITTTFFYYHFQFCISSYLCVCPFVQFSSFCLYVCLKVCLHVLTTSQTVFICSHEWMNDCSICVFVLSVCLSVCLFVWMNDCSICVFVLSVCLFLLCDFLFVSLRKRVLINLFSINNWFFDCLIVNKFVNMFLCFFVWIILRPLCKFVF